MRDLKHHYLEVLEQVTMMVEGGGSIPSAPLIS